MFIKIIELFPFDQSEGFTDAYEEEFQTWFEPVAAVKREIRGSILGHLGSRHIYESLNDFIG